jgi:hypothetical protein
MSDGIDARMQEMESSGCEAVLNRVLAQPNLKKLVPSHHPVLTLG